VGERLRDPARRQALQANLGVRRKTLAEDRSAHLVYGLATATALRLLSK
jgi:hypothetical protein